MARALYGIQICNVKFTAVGLLLKRAGYFKRICTGNQAAFDRLVAFPLSFNGVNHKALHQVQNRYNSHEVIGS
jgi:hypothetical protein